ncbi:MAG: acetylxylan esterase [Prolixibacteraceae bacterium]
MTVKLNFFCLIILLVSGMGSLSAQPGNNALPWRNNIAYNSYLMREVHRQYQLRQSELTKALHSGKEMISYRDGARERYRDILGSFPEKTSLNAKVLKHTQQKGFSLETIIFESLPKRYVTANLYLPQGKGPFPASLELCGHGISGKSGSAEAILMALNGIAVLVVDPIGQGERVQLLDENGKPDTRGATTEHTLLNVGCNLLGSSLAAYEYWDNHRAIDYLESRSDIDKNRLAAYGSSGGGTQVAYLIGSEDRLKVACICSYFTQRERVLELSGPSDGCQHIPGEGNARIEIADMVTMFAPKPVLIMSGLYDFVDYWGATQGFRELQKQYEVLGAKNSIQLFTAESGHGMPKAKREALTSWFRTWLCSDATPVHENQMIRIAEKEMLCTETGQVNTAFADAVTIPKYNLELAMKLATERSTFLQQPEPVLREKIFSLLGVVEPKDKITAEPTGMVKGRTFDQYKYQLLRKGEMPVPCVLVIPEKIAPAAKVVIYLNESGKDLILNDEATLISFVNQGDILVMADLRGYGETADPIVQNDVKYWSREYRNAMISLHIGQSIVGQRVVDVRTLVDFIAADSRFADLAIKLVANGSYGPVAIHAAFLDKRIAQTELSHSIKSYNEMIQNVMTQDAYTNVIPGVLKFYDLKDLVMKAGKARIQWID